MVVRIAICLLAALLALGLAGVPCTEALGDWDVSLAGFWGRTIVQSADIHISQPTPFLDGEVEGVTLGNDPTFGGKLTVWKPNRKSSHRIDFGLELDATRFISDLQPQTRDAEGIAAGAGGVGALGFVTFLQPFDIQSNVMAINLLWRYPVSASRAMPHGRWYPYFGVGGGASISRMRINGGPWQNDVSPVFQGIAGAKFFLARNVGIFAEYKRTQTTHDFAFQFFELEVPLGVNHFVGGLAFHF